jgi:uncharacterized protein
MDSDEGRLNTRPDPIGSCRIGASHNWLFAPEGPREAPILSRHLRNFIAALPPWSGNRRAPACAAASTSAKRGVPPAVAGSTPDALVELGLLYCAGRDDVAIDLVSAHKWFNLAAIRGNGEAKRYRMEIARLMSKREIAEAQRRAREWLARH